MMEIRTDDTTLENRREDVEGQDEGCSTEGSSRETIRASEIAEKIERHEGEGGGEEADERIAMFLHGKGLSGGLIGRLINGDLTDEYIRLFKALDFNDNDIENLQDLWRSKIEAGKDYNNSIDSIAVSSGDSSSAMYLSQDGLYLKEALSEPLIKAFREILAKKPADPVEYLGHWLLHFKVCEERSLRRKEEELELLIEREKLKMKEVFIDEGPAVTIARGEEGYEEDWEYSDNGEL